MPKDFVELGREIGELLREKNAAYGSAFTRAGNILYILFPNGVPVEKYQNFLAITRIVDKLFRIATDEKAFNEDPWRDIAGYAILALQAQQTKEPPSRKVVMEDGTMRDVNEVLDGFARDERLVEMKAKGSMK